MITLHIREEYGFRHWMAVLTNDEYRELIRRWETMRGLGCLVPVDLIIPQATPLDSSQIAGMTFDAQCHIHECSDSFLDGSSYQIPPSHDGRFWIDGESYGTEPRDCADILISTALSTTEAESLLAEILPGAKVGVISNGQDLPLDCSTVARLILRDDPDWPTQLAFPLLPLDSPLGDHPHLTLAEHLSRRLSAKALTDSSGMLIDPQLDPDDLYWWVVRMDAAWYLADMAEAADGRELVRIVAKLPQR